MMCVIIKFGDPGVFLLRICTISPEFLKAVWI